MKSERLSTTVEGNSDLVRLTLAGDVDGAADAALADAYAWAFELRAPTIVLDFAGVDYMNSTGIALIVRLLAEARRDGRAIRAAGLSEHYREIFRITRLADFMTIEDETAAGAQARP